MGSEVKFTPEQSEVIEFRGNNILVSAAAGSGKTTVMIQRVCDLIEKSQVPISKFLIISFTKASASDMKNKLIKKLSQVEPTPFILEQLDDILTSDVSNLHSFCARLLKSYFYEVGLDPTFIVLDQLEVDALKEKALQKLFSQKSETGNKAFYELIDIFSKSRKDKGLKDAILKMHNFLCSIVDKEDWFKNTTEALYNSDLEKNTGAKIINSHMKAEKARCEEKIAEMVKKCEEYNLLDLVAYLQNIDSAFKLIRFDSGFLDNAKRLNLKERLPNMPKAIEGREFIYQEVKALKDDVMERFSKLKEYACSDNVEDLVDNLKTTKIRLENLYSLTKEFEEIFAQLKKEKGGLDFNDLEEYSLQVLQKPMVLDEIKNKYEYIFVDEYQDINGVQEAILTLLSRTNNRFMVGDVKQSIYRFRLCDPEIFLKKYNLYQENGECGKLILLNANFRSKSGILEFVNEIFDATMTDEFGGVDYKGEARLNVGSEGQQDNEKRVELLFADTKNLNAKQEQEEVPLYSVKEDLNNSQSLEKQGQAEGLMIAEKIADLVAHYKIKDANTGKNRKIKFSDITILTLSRTPFLNKLTQTLEQKGIPVSTDIEGDCFEDEYVAGVRAFLEAVACYKVDYSLFSCLYSKLFEFNANELAKIKLAGGNNNFFYENVLNAVNSGLLDVSLQQKLVEFFKIFTISRKKAGFVGVQELARQVIENQDLFAKISFEPDSEKRIQKLNRFLGSLTDQSVYEYLNDSALAEVKCEPVYTGGAVKVMTIHKSKGLEFGVVFLVGVNRNFNFKTLYGNIVVAKDLGVCLDYYDCVARYKTPTIARQAVRLIETRKMLEEEQRLLYVALTRATDYLYIVGSGDFEEIKDEFPISPRCFLDFMGDLYKNPEKHNNIRYDVVLADAEDLLNNDEKTEQRQVIVSDSDEYLINKFKDVLNNKYKTEASINVPMKSSATSLAGENVDQANNFVLLEEDKSSAENGTLQHKVMQYIELQPISIEELKFKVHNLVDLGIISEDQENEVMIEGISKLLNNKEFCALIDNATILKEREFYLSVNAELFNNDASADDRVVVQGIVDLCLIKNQEIIIVDYKTGNISNNLEKYKKQINLYAEAMEKSFNIPVSKKYIAGIKTGEFFDIK